MKTRIVKEEFLGIDGKVQVNYVPEHKVLFWWERFSDGCDVFSSHASFRNIEDAQKFIDNVTRMKGRNARIVMSADDVERCIASMKANSVQIGVDKELPEAF